MLRPRARGTASRILVAVLLLVGVAGGQDRISTLISRLKSGGDFRVRTQAALALGASKSKRAVNPLCAGLNDSSVTVRAASAAALGRLQLGGKTCLEKRYKQEGSASVKSSIKKALARFDQDDQGPAIDGNTKVYVAIGKTADKTGRGGKRVDGLVRKAMSTAARDLSGFVIAPDKETVGQAKKLLAKYSQAKAFYLAPEVKKPSYADGNLTVKVELSVFTYPGRALKGSVPVNLTQQDVSGKDESAEDELIQMAAARALEKLSENVDRFE